jgi:hypothetical protein
MPLLDTRQRGRSWDAALAGRVQVLGPALGLDVLDTLFDRGVFAGLGNRRNPSGNRVQVNVGTRRQQGLFVEDGHTLESPLELSEHERWPLVHLRDADED